MSERDDERLEDGVVLVTPLDSEGKPSGPPFRMQAVPWTLRLEVPHV